MVDLLFCSLRQAKEVLYFWLSVWHQPVSSQGSKGWEIVLLLNEGEEGADEEKSVEKRAATPFFSSS
jgi:hypothetical protein